MRHEDYTVAIVCALSLELTAVRAMLDEVHDGLDQKPHDPNCYCYGRIGKHNLVVACLPHGQIGLIPAAKAASQLLRTFPFVRFGLMVGIAGGVPSSKYDIRLGDIVVSSPANGSGGVVQYDLGKTIPRQNADGQVADEPDFKITGYLNHPPPALLSAVSMLRSNHSLRGSHLENSLSQAYLRLPEFAKEFRRPDPICDFLFQPQYDHVDSGADVAQEASLGSQVPCHLERCDSNYLITTRCLRASREPVIHYGVIASGNQVMRHARTRDKIAYRLDAMCFEMEAAGLVDQSFLIIRGICDYADSHKNKVWQPYAAAVAAAYARELLEIIPPSNIVVERSRETLAIARDSIQKQTEPSLRGTKRNFSAYDDREIEGFQDNEHVTKVDIKNCQRSLYFHELEFRQLDIKAAAPDTCSWILTHQAFKKWAAEHHSLLWIKGKPGAGKSTLMRYLVDSIPVKIGLDDQNSIKVSFFFHGRGTYLQRTRLGLFRSILYQLVDRYPLSAPELVRTFLRKESASKASGQVWNWTAGELLHFLVLIIRIVLESLSVVIFVDAVDECGEEEAISLVEDFCQLIDRTSTSSSRLLICLTCRHYPIIDMRSYVSVHVENENRQDIVTYTKQQLQTNNMQGDDLNDLVELITSKASGVFQWVNLFIQKVLRIRRNGGNLKNLKTEVERIPPKLEELYQDLIETLSEDEKPQSLKLMQWVAFAFRPLSADEVRLAMIIDADSAYESFEELLEDDQIGNRTEDVANKITSLSCGMIESQLYDGNRIVQFIHQSAKDYFVETGYQNFCCDAQSNVEFVDLSHRRLTKSCIKYFGLSGVPSREIVHNQHPAPFSQPPGSSFQEYTTLNWIRHSEQVGQQQLMQTEILELFAWPSSKIYNIWLKDIGYWIPHVLSKRSDEVPATLLHLAAQRGWMSILRILLESIPVNKGNADLKDNRNGRTPLSYASKAGQCEVVEFLLARADVDPNSKDDIDRTPLLYSSANQDEATVRLLLKDKRIDVHVQDRNEISAISRSIRQGHYRIAKLLLEKAAQIQSEHPDAATSFAFQSGEQSHNTYMLFYSYIGYMNSDIRETIENDGPDSHRFISFLFKFGDARNNTNYADSDGLTPLIAAAKTLPRDCLIRHLLDCGADPNSQDKFGRTALSHLVDSDCDPQTIKLLMERGAEPNVKDNNGRTALSHAANSRSRNVREPAIKLLIEKGADLNIKDNNGLTALSYAARSWFPEQAIDLLIEGGADLNIEDIDGRTALSHAANGIYLKSSFRRLLTRSGDSDKKDIDAHIAVSDASYNCYPDQVMKLLIQRGAKVHQRDAFGQTPLSYAYKIQDPTLLVLIYENGLKFESEEFPRATTLAICYAKKELGLNLDDDETTKISNFEAGLNGFVWDSDDSFSETDISNFEFSDLPDEEENNETDDQTSTPERIETENESSDGDNTEDDDSLQMRPAD